MFIFNKNNALPRSRESSIDSLPSPCSPSTSLSTSTSTADACVSQASHASELRDMPSPEQRSRMRDAKRSSVFNLRSRSNTATSTASSFLSLAPSAMLASDTSSHAAQGFLEMPASKRSLFRGKKGKRLSAQFSPNFHVDESEELETVGKRASVLRRGRKMIHHSEGSFDNLKNRISSPFDFQHVTHTDRSQFAAAMEQAPQEHLATDFWAVRASQAPRRRLTGIKAETLHFQNFSSENLTAPQSRPTSALGSTPPTPNLDLASQGSPDSGRSIRMSRSVESFSRPSLSPRNHRHTQAPNPPPRVSSKQPLTRIDDLPEEPCDIHKPLPHAPLRSPFNRYSGFWDKSAPGSPQPGDDKLPSMAEESTDIPHAVTTPDDSAIHTVTPPFGPDLGDVAEKLEQFTGPRPAPPPPPKSPTLPFFESFSFDGNRRSSVSPSSSRRNSNSRGSITRPISQMSDTLGSSPRKQAVRRTPTARQKPNTWRVLEGSWEDDIDFIYDNALEADCDFDWDRSSTNGAYEDRDYTPEQHDQGSPAAVMSQSTPAQSPSSKDKLMMHAGSSPTTFPTFLVPRSNSTPELESRSAISTSTDTGAQTPSDFFSHMGETGAFNLTPSLLVPADFKEEISREDMYEDLLADYEGPDRHFPLLDASQSVSSSTRSSHIRSSKRSSYDSSLMSSFGQGSGSWNSPIRRSASSSGSLPELVHSRRARRDFNLVVEALSEQVTSCASFNDEDAEESEDNNTTPPGRLSHNQTFFASDEQESENEHVRASIEVEVRASLELARRGSTRSSRAPTHKYASSDGAAKLLAAPVEQPSKSRKRAASSSHVVRAERKPYLSLFPAPPRNKLQSPASPLSL